MDAEGVRWGWSLLYQMMKAISLLSGLPQRPWLHTQEELFDTVTTLDEDDHDEMASLALDCLSILRA